ncbi:FliM/FliN family flagellar motor switch protein [Yoonia sp. SS1-5]|uniref:FliM/FliN family flagellar motor switch protein n=1 Tax=Yoonia rhodophyticola TaxID=3137370 RepID=A0AAN0MCB4_9RHOB
MHSTILRRMTGRQTGEAAEMPLTLSRAVRLALTKAADETIGLSVTVTDMAEDVRSLDDLLVDLDATLMLVGLERDGRLAGLMALDMQLRAAVVETQTIGRLIDAPADQRDPTGTDKSLCDAMLAHFLTALPHATAATEFDGWLDGVVLGDRVRSSRAAGLVLEDCEYRVLRFPIDLGVAERTGELRIALPMTAGPATPDLPQPVSQDWVPQFRAAVEAAPATLEAELYRFQLPLSQARDLKAGQVIPLYGCTVNSVRLLSLDGRQVAQAKLGQVGGKRALRIEAAPAAELSELAARGADGAASMALQDEAGPLALDATPVIEGGADGFDNGAALDLPMDAPASDEGELQGEAEFAVAAMEDDTLQITE